MEYSSSSSPSLDSSQVSGTTSQDVPPPTRCVQQLQKVQKMWQELTKDGNNVVQVMKVVDFGVTRSARTGTRQKMRQEEENKTSLNLEVEKRRRKPVPIHLTPQRKKVEKKKTSPKKDGIQQEDQKHGQEHASVSESEKITTSKN